MVMNAVGPLIKWLIIGIIALVALIYIVKAVKWVGSSITSSSSYRPAAKKSSFDRPASGCATGLCPAKVAAMKRMYSPPSLEERLQGAS